MIQYNSQFQTKFNEFNDLFNLGLNTNNRWVLLSSILPWDKLVSVYARKFDLIKGAKGVNPRVIIGALIIKHKLKLSDEETLQTISENPYMQMFLGLDTYCPSLLFSPTLFCEIRKKLGKETFDKFNELLIKLSSIEQDEKKEDVSEHPVNKGKLKIDASVADQYIRYPNDLGILNEVRENTEQLIDQLFALLTWEIKPRTYRKVAHSRYVTMAKMKNKPKNKLRMEIRYQLNCIERNLKSIDKMLDDIDGFPLTHKQQKKLIVAHEVARQQRYMYDKRTNRIDHRIVSPSQPHVRPIVRGKQGKKVEFGSKLGLSLVDGFVTNETLSWDAYNESSDLIIQAEAYKNLYGYYPELIQADKIYWTNQNRTWCKQRDIRITAVPKGKPVEKTAKQIRKEKKEYGERNQIEGKIGNAKQALNLNQIKAKLKETSETWIGITLFVMNLSVFAKNFGVTF